MGVADATLMAAETPGIDSPYPNVIIRRRNAGNVTDPPTWVDEGPLSLQGRTVAVGAGFPLNSCGCELNLGRALDAVDVNKWSILQMGIGGSGIENQWDNPAYPTGGPQAINQLMTIIDSHLTQRNARLELIVPIGGEQDSGEVPDRDNWQAHLQAMFVSKLRGRYGPAKIVIPTLSYHSQAGNSVPNIITGTHQFVMANTGAARIYTNDLSFHAGNVHYNDTNGYGPIGNRVAQAYFDLRNGVTPTNPYIAAVGIPVVGTSAQGVSPVPPTHAANDILVIIHVGAGNTAYGTPAGWTQLTNSPQHNGASAPDARLTVWWKRAVDSATATPTIADVGGDGGKMANILVIRGCTTSGNPFVTSAGATALTSTSVSFPTIDTTGTNNCLVLNILSTVIAATVSQGSAWANASLTSLQQEIDWFNSVSDAGMIVIAGRKATGGAISATTMTLANAGTQAMITLAFAP